MSATRWTNARRPVGRTILTMLSLLPLRGHLPIVAAPREKEGGISWRPVLFGLGAVVGFAVAVGRARTVQAPGHSHGSSPGTTATSSGSGREEGGIARSIHLPAPLRDSIEAELTQEGPVLFSPPDAIDPIGAEALEADAADDDRTKGDV
ncbi:MAG TPA: hypothetical protein VNP95_02325 [Thermomicrobiales bacterium]|nr:hypothetical protein [Thermomicrobiales bacterium]